MGYGYKYRPSKTARREYAQKMNEIDDFCTVHGINKSFSGDSYYFTVNGQKYRVSNHSVEASNRGAWDEATGEKTRALYHENGREDDTVYIHAGKTRIIEIYTALKAGKELDGRGYEK